MLDPLTALNLAAAIVQFVDVWYRVVAGTTEAYTSGSIQSELGELSLLIEDIKASNSKLGANSTALSQDEKALRSLAKTCQDLAINLETKLGNLSVPKNSKFRLVKSAQVSVRAAWKSKDIQASKQRLPDIQNHVQQRITAIAASNQISGLSSDIQALNDRSGRIGISTHTKLNHLVTDLRKLTSSVETQSLDQHLYLSGLVDHINATINAAKQAAKNEEIIGSLWFHMLKDRYDRIDAAYDETLEWLFNPHKTTLSKWLRNGNGIYWVNGLVSSDCCWPSQAVY